MQASTTISRWFNCSVLFQRYTQQHRINDIRLSVVEINGSLEKYYFHVIYREAHSLLATLIGQDLKEGFDK